MPEVKLVSSDGKELLVDVQVANRSTLLRNIIEDTGHEEQIFLPNVKEHVLRKVVDYCRHYSELGRDPPEIPKPLPQPTLEGLVEPWDVAFIGLDVNSTMELIMAANYMDVKGLLELACARLATFIKNKSVEELREIFGIENDFSPEEEAQIREENRWAEEIG